MILTMPFIQRTTLNVGLALLFAVIARGEEPKSFRLATFTADVTVPLGHGMMGGAWRATKIVDPLEAHGLVWLGADKPIVYVAVDWCEIRNDAYRQWQQLLADAAGTSPERVMTSTLHQHDAPVADLEAERMLRARKAAGSVCDPEFHEQAVRRVAAALKASLASAQAITHVGIGQAKVERVASNRRFVAPDGSVRFDRLSRTVDPIATAADEGTIDPWLKTLSFWHGERAVAAVSAYAVHPMSYYGSGEVSADFPGVARRSRQRETPDVKQIYVTGCAGNVTAGKYNDGSRANRAVLADRIQQAMIAAWKDTKKHELRQIRYHVTSLQLDPRSEAGFTAEDLQRTLSTAEKPFDQCLAAMGLSWRKRCALGQSIEVPAIDFGAAQWLLLPGEAYVEFQLAAQAARARPSGSRPTSTVLSISPSAS
ncbi:MAG: hypothetical protein WD176_09210 [Pirellulales bacterium]